MPRCGARAPLDMNETLIKFIGQYEISNPVAKVFPPEKGMQMRNISGLLNFDIVMERLISELMISDMKVKSDPAQFGNEKGTSIQHYLIKMIHRILTVLDNNSRRETFAVVANLIDWNSAFPRQCPKLGIESFIQNGVRASLIPTLINYFQDRHMSVSWHGHQTVPTKINEGGPQGATLVSESVQQQCRLCESSRQIQVHR